MRPVKVEKPGSGGGDEPSGDKAVKQSPNMAWLFLSLQVLLQPFSMLITETCLTYCWASRKKRIIWENFVRLFHIDVINYFLLTVLSSSVKYNLSYSSILKSGLLS